LPRLAKSEAAPGVAPVRVLPGSHGSPRAVWLSHAGGAWLSGVEWPREESNLRTRIRSPSLYPLSYGARSARGGGRDLNPRPPGPQPGALPTELPPPRPMKDSFERGAELCGERPLAVEGEQEEHRPERHREAERPDGGELDGAGLANPWAGLERHGSCRRSGKVVACQPCDLRRRDQDQLRTERAGWRRKSDGGVHGQARFFSLPCVKASLRRVMRVRGVEPPRTFVHRVLNPERLPFRHTRWPVQG
jgi:hypothetical protein